MDAAQIEEAPNEYKRELIRRFLLASGVQHRIDEGTFLHRFAAPGGPIFVSASAAASAFAGQSLANVVDASFGALRAAYAPHKQLWQDEYETHVNWEFAEAELEEIVRFLETSAGQHFLDGRWRMDAYIGTNTEDIVEQIVREAEAAAAAR